MFSLVRSYTYVNTCNNIKPMKDFMNQVELMTIPDNVAEDIESAIYQCFGRNADIEEYVRIVLSEYDGVDDISEYHHIFPRAIFGDNDIEVLIPVKEHFKAHVYLFKGYSKSTSMNGRVMQAIAGGVAAFIRSTENRVEKLAKYSQEELDEYADMVSYAREVNRAKGIGCTHYSNPTTGEIIFAKDCPEGFVKGNKHNKVPFTNSERTELKWCVPGTEPDGWINQPLNPVNQDCPKHYYDTKTGKFVFRAVAEEGFIPGNFRFKGYRAYKNTESGIITKFKDDPGSPWELFNANTNCKRIHNPVTLENGMLKPDDDMPEGWVYGMSPDIVEKITGWTDVYDTEIGEYRRIDLEDFDPKTMIKRGRRTGWTVIYNKETRVHKWHSDKENIPDGWAVGRIDMPSGYVQAYNAKTKETGRFQSTDTIPTGWVRGIPYDKIWVYNGTEEQWVTVDHADELILAGWKKGRPTMVGNQCNKGNFHIHNPATGERATIKSKELLPDGWKLGLLINANPIFKGKKAYHKPGTTEHKYFSAEETIPDGWIRGTGTTKPRKQKASNG